MNLRLHPWVLLHNPMTGVVYPTLNMQKTNVVFNKDLNETFDVDSLLEILGFATVVCN